MSNLVVSEFESLNTFQNEIPILQVPLCHKGVGVLCVSVFHVLFPTKPFD